jgi:UDP-N-acetylmuramate dehydrogenase
MNAGAHGSSLADVLEAVELATPAGLFWVAADELDWGYRSSNLPTGAVVTAAALSLTPASGAEILARHRTLLRVRRQTQPRGVRTFGSTFKNPPGESAGRLLESAGLKGASRGGAAVSALHANFISNSGDASSTDVLGLMTMMREAVYVKHRIFLEPEVRLVGARFPWQG